MATIRIHGQNMAETYIGSICMFNTKDGIEYGKILRVTPSELILHRLCVSPSGDYISHPEPVCPRTRNRVTYMKRNVFLVK